MRHHVDGVGHHSRVLRQIFAAVQGRETTVTTTTTDFGEEFEAAGDSNHGGKREYAKGGQGQGGGVGGEGGDEEDEDGGKGRAKNEFRENAKGLENDSDGAEGRKGVRWGSGEGG